MKVGTEVVLVDSRGAWTVHAVEKSDHLVGSVFRRGNPCWRSIAFTDTGHEQSGRRVFRSDQPAIAGERAWSPLYLPAGWHPPTERRPRA